MRRSFVSLFSMKSIRSVLRRIVLALAMASFVLLIDGAFAQARNGKASKPDEIESLADPGSLPSVNSGDSDAPPRRTRPKARKAKPEKQKSVKVTAKVQPKASLRSKPAKLKDLVKTQDVSALKAKALKSQPQKTKAQLGKDAPMSKLEPKKPDSKKVDDWADIEVVPPSATEDEPSLDVEQSVSAADDDKLLRRENGPALPEPPDLQSPEKAVNNELAVRTLSVPPIVVDRAARKYVANDFETALRQRLLLDIKTLTYLQPVLGVEPLKGGVLAADQPNATIASYVKNAAVDGLLFVQLGLEEINSTVISKSGRLIRTFQVRYTVGELEGKDAEIALSQRIVDALVVAVPYKGYVIKLEKGGALARVNLGSAQRVKVGDLLGLFEFRGSSLRSTRRALLNVEVQEVVGPSESIVAPDKATILGGRDRVPSVAFVSYDKPKTVAVSAEDKSIVSGRWWVSAGGTVQTFGTDAAAAKYESRAFRVNSTPFGTLAFGNDDVTVSTGFGNAISSTETLRFFDLQATYALYQRGANQAAFIVSAGGRVLMIDVVPIPGATSSLVPTNIASPMVELRYQYVPRGRVRLVGIGEVFWPVWSTGAEPGALIFAFGAGVGGSLQLALTERFGTEVYGKTRVLRRTVDGPNGVQERQTILGAGLIFSF